jgi:anti-sigma B factor antagonist
MPAGFDIGITATGPGELTARLSGELDLSARPVVGRELVGAVGSGADVDVVVIDLGGVTFCDSSGLGALLDVQRAAERRGASVVLRSVPNAVGRVLELAGVNDVLPRE